MLDEEKLCYFFIVCVANETISHPSISLALIGLISKEYLHDKINHQLIVSQINTALLLVYKTVRLTISFIFDFFF